MGEGLRFRRTTVPALGSLANQPDGKLRIYGEVRQATGVNYVWNINHLRTKEKYQDESDFGFHHGIHDHVTLGLKKTLVNYR